MSNSNSNNNEITGFTNSSENLDVEKDSNEPNDSSKKRLTNNTSTRFVNAFTNVGYATSKKIVDFTSNMVNIGAKLK
jgi:hypothetical protein